MCHFDPEWNILTLFAFYDFVRSEDDFMRHVLIIEDEPLIADDICELAMLGGATSLDVASSPQQALKYALERPPTLILSDVQIIDGTGPEAVGEIRRRLGDIPVIFITGWPEGCTPYEFAKFILAKPVVGSHLLEAMRTAMQFADAPRKSAGS